MAAEDHFFGDWGTHDDEEYGAYVDCRYCHVEGLHWVSTRRGWRLYDGSGKAHDCRQKTASIDDFEDVS